MNKNIMLVVLLSASLASATGPNASPKLKLKTLPPLPQFVLSTDGKSEADYKVSTQKKLNESQKMNRQIAQTDTIDEKGFLTPSFLEVRNQFFAVQSAEQLDVFINKLSDQDYYGKLDRDGQFLALQLIALKPYKSFVERVKKYLGNHSAVRSAIITNLRIAAVAQKHFGAAQEQKAIFDYITSPMAGMGKDIFTDADLEEFLMNEAMLATDANYRKYLAIVQNSEKPIHWDNKVYASFANFSDSADRFAQVGMAEQYLILAGLEQTIAGQLVTTAYSLDGFSDMVVRMTKEFGIDSMNVMTKVDGMTSKKRFQILKQYPNLFNLKPGGESYTRAAFGFLKASLQNTKLAWNSINKNQPNSQISFAINPQVLTPFNRQINSGFANLDTLFSNGELSSAVLSGDKISINFEKLFTKPPEFAVALYPTEFNSESKTLSKTVNGEKKEYRNYLSDSAKAWSYQTYKEYIPNLKSQNGKTAEIGKELRVLSQVWGANVLGLSIGALVF